MDVGSLFVKLGLDTQEFTSQLKTTEANLQAFGKKMTDTGKKLSVAVTAPLTLMAGVSVKAFTVQEDAELKLRAALQANGRAVDSLFQEYKAFASEMQRVTIVGDEVSLQMLQSAESFGVTGEAAMRAVKNAIAMEAAFGVNAQAAIKMTAALEQGDTALLTRYIPSLRSAGSDTEKLAMAHEVLGRAFSVAEEQAKTSSGQMQQMTNAIGDLQEQFGQIIAEAIIPFIGKIKELAEGLQNMSKEKKTTIVVVAALAAALGPALILIGQMSNGVAALIKMFRLAIPVIMKVNATMLANPYILVGAAIAGLVAAAAFPKLITLLTGADGKFKDVTKSVTTLDTATGELKKAYDDLNGVMNSAEGASEDQIKVSKQEARQHIINAEAIIEEAQALRQLLIERRKDVLIAMQRSKIGGGAQVGEIQAIEAEIKRLEESMGEAELMTFRFAAVLDSIKDIDSVEARATDAATLATNLDKANISLNRLSNSFQRDEKAKAAASVAQEGLNDAIEAGLLGQVNQSNVLDRLNTQLQNQKTSTDAYRASALQATDASAAMMVKLSELGEMAESAIQGTMLQGMYAVTDAFNVFFTTALNDGVDAFGNFTKALLQSLKQILGQLLAAAAAAAALAAIITIATGGTGPVFDFFKGGSQSLLGGLFGGITGFGSFAEGGIVSGPTLGLVGEYAGARSNPEVIAPLSKLQGMLGGMGGEVTFRIQGNELVGILNRQGNLTRRV